MYQAVRIGAAFPLLCSTFRVAQGLQQIPEVSGTRRKQTLRHRLPLTSMDRQSKLTYAVAPHLSPRTLRGWIVMDSLAPFGEVQIMLSEKELRNLLISAFQHLSEQRFALSSVLAEVAAVRDALIEIGPKYSKILDRHRARHMKTAKPVLGEILRKYQAIIQQLKTV